MGPSRGWRAAVTILVVGLAFTGCASEPAGPGSGSANRVIVGTTEALVSLDPAGSADSGSLAVRTQLYASLLTPASGTGTGSGSGTPAPDLATSARFTGPSEYTVTLKSGLTFANGHRLTSSDVKFSFDRQLAIADPAGPSRLLDNLQRVETPSPQTVVFHLKAPGDPLFPKALSSSAGAIVDEQVFSPTAVTPDTQIVTGQGFDGQYTVDSFAPGRLITFVANPHYAGVLGLARSPIAQKFYRDPTNLMLDLQQGVVDVAAGRIPAAEVESLRGSDGIKLVSAPSGEISSLVFNPATQPYGTAQPGADPTRALAVRVAFADLIDRDQIVLEGSRNTATPLFSVIPGGVVGATDPLKKLSGNGAGAPDADAAKKALATAGVPTPVALTVHYLVDATGTTTADEFALLKAELEATGLFSVKLQASPGPDSSAAPSSLAAPVSQLVWSPGYADADQYLNPFVRSQVISGATDQSAVDEIAQQATEPDPTRRIAILNDIQARLAADRVIVPLLQGSHIVLTGARVTGARFGGPDPLRFATLVKH